ncbi:PLP-dependent aminotransferase family protein [Ramlibacter tataouinensis]|uniref:aminotransferase-like domain-containing protein n=1 Tax=Ramlibacter tataouinensis TaxID=94132 RepID=UPI0022F38C31|nr:PLP-dependent aminotransferase family protein [Ramlibacter tataouinensis]WBY02656.1 PLP-dependent aminotransferase family protein [Ramlibacter tataouinensis]
MKKYERLARDIEELVDAGTLAPGDRLPSVREAVSRRGVSASTVFEAYYLLESRGLIEARPRSGYFVKSPRRRSPEPHAPLPREESTSVAVYDRVQEALGSIRDRDVVPMGSAFPSPRLFPLHRLARAGASAMRRLEPDELLQDISPGNEELRRQLALRYAANGTAVGTDEVIVTNGAMEALNLCLRVATRPGDVVAIESPAFYGCLQALEWHQLKAVEISTHPRDGVQLDSLQHALERHPIKACWFMPNFQNPTGSLMPVDKKQALVELLAQHGVPLIEDDAYAELYFGARRPPPAKAFDRQGLVMHCSSFSKCLAPGYRIGWAAAGRFAREVERLKLMSTLSVAVPSQVAVLDYLLHAAYDKHLRGLRAALAERQAQALEAIERHFPAGTRVTRPEGGYLLWVELPDGVDGLQLQRLALARRISLTPGHLFSTAPHFHNFVRLNYGHPAPGQLEGALRTLGRLVHELAAEAGGSG